MFTGEVHLFPEKSESFIEEVSPVGNDPNRRPEGIPVQRT